MKVPEVNPEPTFEESIATTRQLLENFVTGALTPDQLQTAITTLLRTSNGARGFFVVWLTHDWQVSLAPIVHALNTHPDPSRELMVKNLVMSTAMAITHQRQGNATQAQMSLATARRSTELLNQWKHPHLASIVQSMIASIDTDGGDYGSFLQKWGYDTEQKQAMKSALLALNL